MATQQQNNYIVYKLGRRPFLLSEYSENSEGAFLTSPILRYCPDPIDGRALAEYALKQTGKPVKVTIKEGAFSVVVHAPSLMVTRVVSKNSIAKQKSEQYDAEQDLIMASYVDFRTIAGEIDKFITGVEFTMTLINRGLVEIEGELTYVILDDAKANEMSTPDKKLEFVLQMYDYKKEQWNSSFLSGYNKCINFKWIGQEMITAPNKHTECTAKFRCLWQR